MDDKGMLSIDMIILVAIGVVVLVVVVGLVMVGGQQPGSDLAKQAFVRSCCQLNSQIVCSNLAAAKCIVPGNLKSFFGSGQQDLKKVATDIGIIGDDNVKKFCGC